MAYPSLSPMFNPLLQILVAVFCYVLIREALVTNQGVFPIRHINEEPVVPRPGMGRTTYSLATAQGMGVAANTYTLNRSPDHALISPLCSTWNIDIGYSCYVPWAGTLLVDDHPFCGTTPASPNHPLGRPSLSFTSFLTKRRSSAPP